jgi:CheY-like chemotaxis protein
MKRPLILIVEDDQALRELYQAEMRLAGYQVRTCEDGAQALRVLEHTQPDAVVLDLDLPRVPGAYLRGELQWHPHTRDIPVVVCTGMADPLPPLPDTVVLRKPCTADQLINAIDSVLRTSDHTAARRASDG